MPKEILQQQSYLRLRFLPLEEPHYPSYPSSNSCQVNQPRDYFHLCYFGKIQYPEYFRVKCYNSTSLRLWTFLLTLRSTNKHFWRHCRGTVVILVSKPSLPVYPLFLPFFSFYNFSMEQPTIQNLSAPKGEFVQPPQSSKPITTSSYELRPGFIAMVQEQAFLGLDYENPYYHLREFEQLCACLTISGMSQEILWWKLFPFSLDERAKQWYAHNEGKVVGYWEELRNRFCLAFFPISRIAAL